MANKFITGQSSASKYYGKILNEKQEILFSIDNCDSPDIVKKAADASGVDYKLIVKSYGIDELSPRNRPREGEGAI